MAAALAIIAKKRVLLIDLDSQGNATTSVGLDKNALEYTMADVLLDGVSLQDAILSTDIGLMSLVPTEIWQVLMYHLQAWQTRLFT